jgi:hypothetical protein
MSVLAEFIKVKEILASNVKFLLADQNYKYLLTFLRGDEESQRDTHTKGIAPAHPLMS